jgi:hypothetical protein
MSEWVEVGTDNCVLVREGPLLNTGDRANFRETQGSKLLGTLLAQHRPAFKSRPM